MDNILEQAKTAPFSVEELLLNRGVVVEEVAISELDLNDHTFATHDDNDDIGALEESLRQDGQLDPIVARRHEGRWQVVDGFRRVRAAMHLGWHKIKARRFDQLPAEQAALWAVKNITVTLPYPEALEALAQRMEEHAEHAAADVVRRHAQAVEVVEDDQAATVEHEQIEAQANDEVTIDALAEQTLEAFSAQSENVQLLQENWADVPAEAREAMLAHLRYYADLLQFLDAPADAAVGEEAPAEEPEPEPTA